MKKLILRSKGFILFCLVLGVILGIFGAVYEEEIGEISTSYLVLGTGILIIIFLFIMIYPTLVLRKRIKTIIEEVGRTNDYKAYIDSLEKLLNARKKFFDMSYYNNRQYIIGDLGVGYMILGDFQKAIDTFNKVDRDVLKGPSRAAFYGNYGMCLFNFNKTEEALDLMEYNREIFKTFYKMKNIGFGINICYIKMMIEKKKFDAIDFYLKALEETAAGAIQEKAVEDMKNNLEKEGYWTRP